jgi:hypothetical protein
VVYPGPRAVAGGGDSEASDRRSARSDIPEFSVVAIGAESAGKTTFLAMMYEMLCVDPNGERGYHISTDLASASLLNQRADQIRRPGNVWPQSTMGRLTPFEFDFQMRVGGGPRGILRLRYVDYPGDLLEDPEAGNEAVRRALETEIAKASALLVVIDGYLVLGLMQQDQRRIELLHRKLRAVVQRVQHGQSGKNPRALAPLQVLVTKWDMLADEGHSLQEVRRKLIADRFFRGMVATRMPDGQSDHLPPGRVRLIPVSVLGKGAVERLERGTADGSGVHRFAVVKRAGFRPRPINLDVPFAAILPDLLDQVLAALSPRQRRRVRRAERWRRLRANGRWFERHAGRVLLGTQQVLAVVLDRLLPGSSALAGPVLNLLGMWMARRAGEPMELAGDRSGREGARGDYAPPVTLEAQAALLQRFATRVESFERAYEGWDAMQGYRVFQKRPERQGAQ